jgi:hypothetical protein
MGTLSIGVCIAVLYLVGATMYRSTKAGWRPNRRPGELTDILLWHEETQRELAADPPPRGSSIRGAHVPW